MSVNTTVIEQAAVQAQLAYCEKIRALWMSRGITPKAYVETY